MAASPQDRPRRTWSTQEDEKLRLLVSYWGDQSGKNGHWDKISSHFDNRSSKDCRKRWFHSLDPKLRRGRWTEAEDRTLVEAYQKLGPAWQRIAQQIPGRTDDQCSKRYNDVLNPEFQDRLREWTTDDDQKLMHLVRTVGTHWSDICKELPGRTGLTCRNRWRKLTRDLAKQTSSAHDDLSEQGATFDDSSDLKSSSINGLGATESPDTDSIGVTPVNRRRHDSQTQASTAGPSIEPESVTSPPIGSVGRPPSGLGAQNMVGVNPERMAPGGPLPARPMTFTLEDQSVYDAAQVSRSGGSNSSGIHYPLTDASLDKILQAAAKTGQKIVIHQHIYNYPTDGSGLAGPQYVGNPASQTDLAGPGTLGLTRGAYNGMATSGSRVNLTGLDARERGLTHTPFSSMSGPPIQPHLPLPQLPASGHTSMSQSPRVLPETAQPPDELILGPSGMFEPDVRGNPFELSEMSHFDFLAFNPS